MATIQYEVPNNVQRMTIGVQGENNVREFLFDVTEWRQITGDIGTAEMVVQRNGDSSPYAAVITMHDENTVSWVPTSTDTEKAGAGKLQLMWIAGGQTVKTKIFDMKVDPSLDYAVPDTSLNPWASWMPGIINADANYKGLTSRVDDLQQMIASPFNTGEAVADMAALNAIQNPAVNEAHYVISESCRYGWTGSKWTQVSMDESKYTDELDALSAADAGIRRSLYGPVAVSPTWQSGRYDSTTGEQVSSATFARTADLIPYTEDLCIIPTNAIITVRYRVYYYDGNQGFLGFSGATANNFHHRGIRVRDFAPEGTAYFTIAITANESTAITSSTAKTIGETVLITTWNPTLLPDGTIRDLVTGKLALTPVWEPGAVNTAGANAASNNFVRTKDYIPYSRAYCVLPTNSILPLRFRVMYYDENHTFLAYSGTSSSRFHLRGVRLRDYAPEGTAYFRVTATYNNDGAEFDQGSAGYTILITTWDGLLLPQDPDIPALWAKVESMGLDPVPDYYADYLDGKASELMALRDSLSRNTDSFFFVTDYHWQYNAGRSPAMIRDLAQRTGISRLIFAGDAGGASNASKKYLAGQKSAQVYDTMSRIVDRAYGTLGNHEWNDGVAPTYTMAGNIGFYLERYKPLADEMDPNTGNYYVDNRTNKIRYIFVQCSVGAAPYGLSWLADCLNTVPDGWAVAVTMHHAFLSNAETAAETEGVEIDESAASQVVARRFSRLLGAYESKTSVSITVDGAAQSFHFEDAYGSLIGLFAGHYHHGMLVDRTSSEYGINIWRGSTDCMMAATVSLNGHPWYWENGVIGGTKVERLPDTTDEQCFYAVMIDRDAGMVHIKAVGGDHDWSFDFG